MYKKAKSERGTRYAGRRQPVYSPDSSRRLQPATDKEMLFCTGHNTGTQSEAKVNVVVPAMTGSENILLTKEHIFSFGARAQQSLFKKRAIVDGRKTLHEGAVHRGCVSAHNAYRRTAMLRRSPLGAAVTNNKKA